MLNYIITACVIYESPLNFEDRASGRVSRCQGYFVKLGISVGPHQSPQDVLNGIITDGAICWEDTAIELVDWDALEDEIKRNSEGLGSSTLWYTGPRFLFP